MKAVMLGYWVIFLGVVLQIFGLLWDLEPPPIGDFSWPEAGSTLPTVASPSFSYEPAYSDNHVREGDPKFDDPIPALSTPSFLWAFFQECVRSTTQRFVPASGAGSPFSEILGIKPRAFSFWWVVSES